MYKFFFFSFPFEGDGWFTFNLLQAFISANSNGSVFNIYQSFHSHPYLKLFVNGEQAMETQIETDRIVTIDDITHQTGKIPKTSIIKLEIWSNDHMFWTNDKLLFQSEGDVESFLTQPFRTDNQTLPESNTVDTVSFWRDEYE